MAYFQGVAGLSARLGRLTVDARRPKASAAETRHASSPDVSPVSSPSSEGAAPGTKTARKKFLKGRPCVAASTKAQRELASATASSSSAVRQATKGSAPISAAQIASRLSQILGPDHDSLDAAVMQHDAFSTDYHLKNGVSQDELNAALALALNVGNVQATARLLDEKANIYYKPRLAIHDAVESNSDPDVVSQLVGALCLHNADLSQEDAEGCTAMQRVSSLRMGETDMPHGKVDAATVLLVAFSDEAT